MTKIFHGCFFFNQSTFLIQNFNPGISDGFISKGELHCYIQQIIIIEKKMYYLLQSLLIGHSRFAVQLERYFFVQPEKAEKFRL